jgi:hypothetical protein
MATTTEERNKELMQTLDDAWNAQDVDVFRERHKPDVIVRWPGQPDPTVGIEDHTTESIASQGRRFDSYPAHRRPSAASFPIHSPCSR